MALVFQTLLPILAPVFAAIAVGFVWARRGGRFDMDMITPLITGIGVPCLAFHALAGLSVEGDAFARMTGAAVGALIIYGVVGSGVLALASLPVRAFLPPILFANTGNMGLPLCLLAFGDVGLALAMAVFTVNVVGQFTLGIAIASGRFSLKALLREPVLYAIAAGIACLATGWTPPRWLDGTAKLLGGFTIPLMLIALGVSLARLKVADFAVSGGLAVLRLALGLAVGVGLAVALGLQGAERGVLIIQSAMPAAVFNYLFAQRYRAEPERVAGVVVVSSALSFATLPFILWFVL